MVKLIFCLTLTAAATPRALFAQKLFGFGGLEFRTGVADPEHADKGLNYALDADLGYLWRPALRTYVGLDGFSADVDRTVAGEKVGGSMSGLGLTTGLRFDVLPLRFLSPYWLLGLSFTNVSARDVTEPTTSDLVDGFNTSGVIGAGIAWRIGPRRKWALVGDWRQDLGSDVSRTMVTVGVRWSRNGRDMYTPERKEAPAAQPVASTTAATPTTAPTNPPTTTPTTSAAVPAAAATVSATDSARIAADRERYTTVVAMQRTIPGIVAVRETDSTVTIVLDETVFDSTTGGLSATGQSTMRSTASSLAAWPNAGVRVEGHADSTGNTTTDQRASDQRAESVRAALIAGGVSPTRISSSTGYGASRPVADNSTPDGRAKNRRAEIVVTRAKQ